MTPCIPRFKLPSGTCEDVVRASSTDPEARVMRNVEVARCPATTCNWLQTQPTA